MVATKKRPVFLNLFIIRLPIAGVASIAHRLTGVLLVVSLPFLLYGLERSLRDADGFAQIMRCFHSFPGRILLLLALVLFAQHLASGIRHLLLSVDVGMSPLAATRSAWFTFVFTLASALLLGMMLW